MREFSLALGFQLDAIVLSLQFFSLSLLRVLYPVTNRRSYVTLASLFYVHSWDVKSFQSRHNAKEGAERPERKNAAPKSCTIWRS